MQLRRYNVYVTGRRISTETKILARGVQEARMKFANQCGLKSFQVDAVWDREYKVPTLRYAASR